ncbi:dehydrogenase-like protein [Dothistroma septosporum NZE10]|uniref:Norsolorinic acid ketoreductase nor1 n=1 Tax=Dothistroma septosporum (strain NZE10 / CBS 128990) TaxID=675120 RepID=NOR1_DOTSN|nr:RecName: Full=Norsolorinic acid ketoreductase nor1; AltName: Full=Dothistromin biosynthesis ketoreductase nor1; AltName: Full=Short chain dehydrogenase nor1 [Dothistroma septosporum NZE10]EME39084.1 dehydrogenase-like protein [Dothistroma septosporum NZE10]
MPSFHNTITIGHRPNGDSKRTTYLVTGASRGIGKGLVASFLARPDSTVIACVRNVASQSKALSDLPCAEGSSLIVVKLDCAVETDPASAVEELQSAHNIRHIDVVVANAAIAGAYGPTSTLPLDAVKEHMQINCYSVLLLFQATRPLLEQAAPGKAKFVFIGAPISTITQMEECARAPLGAYGLTKLAANYLVRKFHFENKWLMSFVIDPGHVQTDMGDSGARLMGRKEAPTTLQQSVDGICARIDEATKEESSGQFLLHEDGSRLPW